MDPALDAWWWLVLAGVASGWVNTLAGGGSLVAVPALMWYGLSADVANGTNRVAIVVQCLTALLAFRKNKLLDAPLLARSVVPSVSGAALGAYCATLIPGAVFRPLLLGTLALVAVLLFVRTGRAKGHGQGAAPHRATPPLAYGMLFAAGLYGGMFQAGVGLVLLFVLCETMGVDLVRANAVKVGIALLYSVVAVWVFAAQGRVEWTSGLVLAVGNSLGAVLGVRFALRADQDTIRKVVLAGALAVVLSVVLKGCP